MFNKNNTLFIELTNSCNLKCKSCGYWKPHKISNISVEGPSKTLSGGQYANPIIKFGKTARLEMQDALGHIDAIDALCGGIAERIGGRDGDYIGLHVGADFNTPKIIV